MLKRSLIRFRKDIVQRPIRRPIKTHLLRRHALPSISSASRIPNRNGSFFRPVKVLHELRTALACGALLIFRLPHDLTCFGRQLGSLLQCRLAGQRPAVL